MAEKVRVQDGGGEPERGPPAPHSNKVSLKVAKIAVADIHVERGPNGRLYPTEKGAAIAADQLPRVLKALKRVRAHARKIGVLPPGSGSR